MEILSLICTNLPSQEDRHRASFVSRYWRRTIIQCPELWSKLTLSKGGVYVKTFLERAKGSQLDIIVDHEIPVGTVALLSPLAEQIRCFDFLRCEWTEIQSVSEVISGSLRLLHTLTVDFAAGNGPDRLDQDGFEIPPPSPLPFSKAVNLKAFRFHSACYHSPFILRLVFPSLVSFDLSTEHWGEFPALRLFDFLEGSPMLEIVKMQVLVDISFEGVPEKRVVSLPSVENFTLVVSDCGPGYEMATHIRCPSARFTSVTLKASVETDPEVIFPPLVSWNAILRQYTRSPPEEVTLEVWSDYIPLTCRLAFESLDSTRISLGFEELGASNVGALIPRISTQAIRTICNHPQLANIKRLRICNIFPCPGTAPYVGSTVRQPFNSLGPLDEMTIYRCDLRPYLRSILKGGHEEPVAFPSVKELTILHPTNLSGCEALIVGLAKSQYARGIPFERVVIQGVQVVEGVEEALRPWVGSVECYCQPVH